MVEEQKKELEAKLELANASQINSSVVEVDSYQLQQYQSQIDRLQEENQRIKEENADLKNKVRNLEETIEAANDRELQSVEQIKRLGEELTLLREKTVHKETDHLIEVNSLRQEVEKKIQEQQALIEDGTVQKVVFEQRIESLQKELDKTQALLNQANQQPTPEVLPLDSDTKSVDTRQRYIERLECIRDCYNHLDKQIGEELLQVCPIEKEEFDRMPGFERFSLLVNTLKNGVQYDQQLVHMVLDYLVQLVGNERETEYNDFARIEEMFKILCNRSRHMSSRYLKHNELVEMVINNLRKLVRVHTEQRTDDFKFIENTFIQVQKREENLLRMNEALQKELEEARKVRSEVVRIAYTKGVLESNNPWIDWNDLHSYVIRWEQQLDSGRMRIDRIVSDLRKKVSREETERKQCQKYIREYQSMQFLRC